MPNTTAKETIFNKVLNIAYQAIQQRFNIKYGAIYWSDDDGQFKSQADIQPQLEEDQAFPFSISTSLIGAVRKIVFIPNTIKKAYKKNQTKDDIDRYLLIILPLVMNSKTIGILSFWGQPDSHKLTEADRSILELTSGICIQTFNEFKDYQIDSSEQTMKPIEELSVSSPKNLIDFIELGVFTFNSEGLCFSENKKVLQNIFGKSIDNEKALEVLFTWGVPKNPDSPTFDAQADLVGYHELLYSVFSRMTDLDVIMELLPTDLEINQKQYGIQYYYVKSDEQVEKDKILVILSNLSSEISLKQQIEIENSRNNMIVKVAMDIPAYRQFRSELDDLIEIINLALTQNASEVNINRIIHHLHIIQGELEIFEMNEMVNLCQGLIQSAKNILHNINGFKEEQKNEFKDNISNLADQLDHIQTSYLASLLADEKSLGVEYYKVSNEKLSLLYNQIVNDVLKDRLDRLEEVFVKNYLPFSKLPRLAKITQQRITRVKYFIQSKVADYSSEKIGQLIDSLKCQPIGMIFNKYEIIAKNLAERLKKTIEVEIIGHDIEIPIHQYRELFNSIAHLVRNSVEHGLEFMEERIQSQKSLEGNLSLSAEIQKDQLILIIKDDGRGMDLLKIKQTAIDNNFIAADLVEELDDHDLWQLIFRTGYSTRGGSDFGKFKGIGLEMVQTCVEGLNGKVIINTAPEKGTSVEIKVPYFLK